MMVSELITKLQGFKQDALVRYTGADMSWSADFNQIFQVDSGTEAVVMFATNDVMTFGALPDESDIPDDVLEDEGWIEEPDTLGEL